MPEQPVGNRMSPTCQGEGKEETPFLLFALPHQGSSCPTIYLRGTTTLPAALS